MSLNVPLRFNHLAFEKVWGGRALESFAEGALPASGLVGEIWELVDRDGASSKVASGPFEGRKLRGLMLSESDDLLGRTKANKGDYFPLLIKYLDAAQNLSVQVHPDERAAQSLGGGAESKTECWYILSAEPGARLYLGFKPGIERPSIATKCASADIVEMLESYEVKAGDFVFVPPGTVHAIGAGITLVEVQENSDTTYRMYDWGRTGLDGEARECHIDEALKSIDYASAAPIPVQPEFTSDGGVNEHAPLVDCDVFTVDALHVNGPLEGETCGRAWIYIVTDGKGELTLPGRDETWALRRGETWLLPASLGSYRLDSVDGQLKMLRVETKA